MRRGCLRCACVRVCGCSDPLPPSLASSVVATDAETAVLEAVSEEDQRKAKDWCVGGVNREKLTRPGQYQPAPRSPLHPAPRTPPLSVLFSSSNTSPHGCTQVWVHGVGLRMSRPSSVPAHVESWCFSFCSWGAVVYVPLLRWKCKECQVFILSEVGVGFTHGFGACHCATQWCVCEREKNVCVCVCVCGGGGGVSVCISF